MFYKLMFFLLFVLLSNLQAFNLNTLSSLEASFKQIITNSVGKKIEYKGKLFISNPSKILWQYKTPVVKNVYVINNFAIVDEPELEQAIFTSLDENINILKMLKTAKKINKNLYVASINEVDYSIYIKNNKISSIKYKDNLENKVAIYLDNSVYNKEIKKEIFSFKAPKHYDIIRK